MREHTHRDGYAVAEQTLLLGALVSVEAGQVRRRRHVIKAADQSKPVNPR